MLYRYTPDRKGEHPREHLREFCGMEVASQTPVTALVTDLRMPRLDGKALIRRLRESRPALPVVVLTGYAPADWRTNLTHDGEGPLVLLDNPCGLTSF